METINFVYWLQGFFEISDAKKLDEKQVQIIKDHLALVFNKITPDRSKTKGADGTTSPIFEFDLMPKTSCSVSPEGKYSTCGTGSPKAYCATSSFDLDLLTKKVC